MCGVVAGYPLEGTDPSLTDKVFRLISASRNRGREGFGFSALVNGGELERHVAPTLKELKEKLDEYKGRASLIIAHTRYQTSGAGNSPSAMQPFHADNAIKSGPFAFAFNGNIVNDEEIAERMKKEGQEFKHSPVLDTEVLQKMIVQQIEAGIHDQKRILSTIHNAIDGCCNIIMADKEGNLSIAKDKWGFRPLVYSVQNGIFYAASESAALTKIGCRDVQFIGRRKIVQIDGKTKAITKQNMGITDLPPRKQGCFFEVVYFTDSDTLVWGEPSSAPRRRFGQALGEEDVDKFSEADTIIVDIPASSEEAASGYAGVVDIPHLRAITKHPDWGRMFIAGSATRKIGMKEKYIFNPNLKHLIKGKRVLLMDDSLVRGDTLEYIVKAFQEYYEPAEIHLRIPSPAIVAPCFYGINLAKINELIAAKYFQDIKNPRPEELKALAAHFGATSLRYLTISQLIESLRMNVSSICLGCVTGNYPTPGGQKKYNEQLAAGGNK